MRHRLLLLALVAVLAGACGRATMSEDEATQLAVDAFTEAGFSPEVGEVIPDATVDRANDGAFIQVHQVELIIDGESYLAGVDKQVGAIVRLDEPPDTVLDIERLEIVASYRDNPAEDRARPRRLTVAIILLVLLCAAVYGFFRRERARAEAAGRDADEIPL